MFFFFLIRSIYFFICRSSTCIDVAVDYLIFLW